MKRAVSFVVAVLVASWVSSHDQNPGGLDALAVIVFFLVLYGLRRVLD